MKKNIRFIVAFLVIFSILAIMAPASEAIIRIMPLGNSITRGSTGSSDKTGYRRYLDLALTGEGYDIDFVGSLSEPIGSPSDFDKDHEGHSGYTDSEIADNVYDYLTTNPADIVLLHIGTNNIDVDQSAVDVERILDEIDRYEDFSGTEIWVILARIINRNCSIFFPVPCLESVETTTFNNNVAAMAQDRIDLDGDKILIVDMENEAGIDYHLPTDIPPGDMADNLHPFDTGFEKMANIWFSAIHQILLEKIITTRDIGIWYWDVAESTSTQMTSEVTTGDITAGDFTGDSKADVASSWDNGLWYQDGVTLAWTKIDNLPAFNVTAGDVTGDGRDEIIGTWDNGVWYWDFVAATWTQMTAMVTTGDIAAGDFTGDGKADVASNWANGLWYQDGATLAWNKIDNLPAYSLTAGDVTGDGRDEIIGTWSNGIWYWDFVAATWTQMTAEVTTGDIAAGDFTGDGKADVASIWEDYGLWYQDGASLTWTLVANSPSLRVFRLATGDVLGQ